MEPAAPCGPFDFFPQEKKEVRRKERLSISSLDEVIRKKNKNQLKIYSSYGKKVF